MRLPRASIVARVNEGDWAFHELHPYTVGPAYLANGQAELAPVEPIKIAIGLQYDLAL